MSQWYCLNCSLHLKNRKEKPLSYIDPSSCKHQIMHRRSKSFHYAGGDTQIAIVDRRTRKATFERRKKGLLKKASEFSTLCEVDTCVIIFPPWESSPEPAQTWPSDPKQVTDIIGRYYNTRCKKPRKNYDLREFFNDKKNQAEAETSRLREKQLKNKETTENPTWDTTTPAARKLGRITTPAASRWPTSSDDTTTPDARKLGRITTFVSSSMIKEIRLR